MDDEAEFERQLAENRAYGIRLLLCLFVSSVFKFQLLTVQCSALHLHACLRIPVIWVAKPVHVHSLLLTLVAFV